MSIISQVTTKIRNTVNKVIRPAAVTEAQHKHLKDYPACTACGASSSCQAHHIKPYNKYPELASSPDNFITLCEHVGGPEHHLNIGHGGNFKMYNPNVVEDAKATKAAKTQAERDTIIQNAKNNRQPDN